MLTINNITKTYFMGDNRVDALRGVSFDVKGGEYVAIMGQSGSGKSTLMNILGCLDTPTSGKYLLDNIDVSKMNPDRLADVRNRKLGFIFQSFNLLPTLNVLENVMLPMVYAGVKRPDRIKIAKSALEKVELAHRLDHYPYELSGGQMQRVAIARSLVNNPEIILADEPTGNLDSQTQIEILKILQGLNAQGTTIILVTHEPSVAETAKRLISFKDGKQTSDIDLTMFWGLE